MSFKSSKYGNFLSAGKSINIDGVSVLAKLPHIYVEEKFDGHRLILSKVENKYYAHTRGGHNKAEQIPHIISQLEKMNLPNDTILDVEALVIAENSWNATQSELGSKGIVSEDLKIIIFDVQRWAGFNIFNESYLTRRETIRTFMFDSLKPQILKSPFIYGDDHVYHARSWSINNYKRLWNDIMEHNGEGIMLKHDLVRYEKGWTKVKKQLEVDCFVIGTTPGKGKFEGMIGALEVAVYHHGAIYPIGKITSLGDLNSRAEATQLAIDGKLKHKVLTVRANDVTKNKKLRHGVFVRWYDDKLPEECLLKQLEDF